jgi:hypothetical protein
MGKLGPRCGTFTATRSRVWQYLNNEHLSSPTNGALRQRTAGEFLVPLSIVLLKVTAGLVRWHSQQLLLLRTLADASAANLSRGCLPAPAQPPFFSGTSLAR